MNSHDCDPIIYIAGKMRGLEDYGRARFNEAEEMLSADGFIVLNPARLPIGMPDESYMPICLAMLQAADCILMLDGWEDSTGALVEYSFARCQHKMIYFESDFSAERTQDGSKKTKTGSDGRKT